MSDWLKKVEQPLTRDDKYTYQILMALNEIINIMREVNDKLDVPQTPKFVKPIGTKDEPNETVTEEIIHESNVDNKLGEVVSPENLHDYTVKELRDLAKSMDLSGYSNLNKDDLIDMLLEG